MNNPTQLIDAFGRIHDYLRISLTERCNLRCFYCMPEEGLPLKDKTHFMTTDEIITIAKTFIALGVKKIRLTGGEPLICKDAHNIIQQLGKLDAELAITTNGVLVDRFIDTFKIAGIHSVNVSLDSLIEEKQNRISRRNYFERVLKNIYLLIEHGFHVKINVVVLKDLNTNELIDFVELSKNHKVHLRFIEFMPFDGNKWDWSKGFGYKEMMDIFSAHYGSSEIIKHSDKPHDTAKCYSIKNYKGTFGVISSVTNPFCSTCNRIRLTADGKMKNCLFSNNETDLLSPLRQELNITTLIINSILSKKAERGGMKQFDKIPNTSEITKNRSMVSIGG